MKSFKDLKLSSELYAAIEKLGFSSPTEVQAKSIPLIMEGKDVLGESATGSGKTLAFGCGVIDKVIPGKGIQALVMTPTRELAEQVKNSIVDLNGKNLRITSVYGGVSIQPQIRALQSTEVVVGTPGRILDHLNQGTINLGKIKILILDEADRMLDMGFVDDVEKIISHCNKERQTLFFSATISYEIKKLANKYMTLPEEVSATKQVDPSKLKQIYYDVPKNQKMALLTHLLKNEKSGLVIVFSNTRRNTDFITKNLNNQKIEAVAIHGGLAQNKRSRTIENFNGNGKASVLVCTDVAARGIHIDNVSHVYNYDLPGDCKDYVHRIGRTARAGEEGEVINLVCKFDYESFSDIRHKYSEFKIEELDMPKFERIEVKITDSRRSPRRGFQGGRGGWDKPARGQDRDNNSRSRDSGRRSYGSRDNNSREGGRSYGNRDSGSKDGFRGSRGGRSSSGRSYGSNSRDSGRSGGSYGNRDSGRKSFGGNSRGRDSGSRGGSYGSRDNKRSFGGNSSGRSYGNRDNNSREGGRDGGSRGEGASGRNDSRSRSSQEGFHSKTGKYSRNKRR